MNESNKEDQIKTIVFASFFCDISLKESGQLHYRTEASMKDLWDEDKKMVLEHAFKASEVVTKYKNAPAMAGEIIKQHHGSLGGKSLPVVISDALLPLSKCLMAAQELAFNILKNQDMAAPDVIKGTAKNFEGTPLHPYLKMMDK